MFMLSFIFVTVCCLFELKRIWTFFLIIYLYLNSCWSSNYQEGKPWDPINQFGSVICEFISQARTWIANAICHGLLFVFNELRWEGGCLFCLYWQNCWQSLFKYTFIIIPVSLLNLHQ
jgi:hypothetical protein